MFPLPVPKKPMGAFQLLLRPFDPIASAGLQHHPAVPCPQRNEPLFRAPQSACCPHLFWGRHSHHWGQLTCHLTPFPAKLPVQASFPGDSHQLGNPRLVSPQAVWSLSSPLCIPTGPAPDTKAIKMLANSSLKLLSY